MRKFDGAYLTKHGLMTKVWNDEADGWILVSAEDVHPFRMLREVCHIEDDVTLADVFQIMETYPELKHFIKHYSACVPWVDEFHEAAKNPQPDLDEVDPLSFLEVYPITTLEDFTDYELGKEIQISVGFHGVGTVPRGDDGKPQSYSIEASPVSTFAHLPLKLKGTCEVWLAGKQQSGKYLPDQPIFEGERILTLLDVLDAIYWEISFHGGEEDKIAFWKKLQDRRDDCENGDVDE